MRATAVTDIGKTRAVNQDYVYTSVDRVGCLPNLFIVADGMGGHKAGDTASRFTVETVKRLISESDQLMQYRLLIRQSKRLILCL